MSTVKRGRGRPRKEPLAIMTIDNKLKEGETVSLGGQMSLADDKIEMGKITVTNDWKALLTKPRDFTGINRKQSLFAKLKKMFKI